MEASQRAEDQATGSSLNGAKLPPVIGVSSGGCFHVLDPREDEVHLRDIAHHTSQIVRYTGAVSQGWSVALHCIEVSHRIAAAGGSFVAQLQGLIHDASEAYLVDLPRPIKDNEWPNYRDIEARIERVICAKLGVPLPFDPIVKRVDDQMVPLEVANFFPPGSFMWQRYAIMEARHDLMVISARAAEESYIMRFEELGFLVDRFER